MFSLFTCFLVALSVGFVPLAAVSAVAIVPLTERTVSATVRSDAYVNFLLALQTANALGVPSPLPAACDARLATSSSIAAMYDVSWANLANNTWVVERFDQAYRAQWPNFPKAEFVAYSKGQVNVVTAMPAVPSGPIPGLPPLPLPPGMTLPAWGLTLPPGLTTPGDWTIPGTLPGGITTPGDWTLPGGVTLPPFQLEDRKMKAEQGQQQAVEPVGVQTAQVVTASAASTAFVITNPVWLARFDLMRHLVVWADWQLEFGASCLVRLAPLTTPTPAPTTHRPGSGGTTSSGVFTARTYANYSEASFKAEMVAYLRAQGVTGVTANDIVMIPTAGSSSSSSSSSSEIKFYFSGSSALAAQDHTASMPPSEQAKMGMAQMSAPQDPSPPSAPADDNKLLAVYIAVPVAVIVVAAVGGIIFMKSRSSGNGATRRRPAATYAAEPVSSAAGVYTIDGMMAASTAHYDKHHDLHDL